MPKGKMHIVQAEAVPPEPPKAAPIPLETPESKQALNALLSDIRRVSKVLNGWLETISDTANSRQNELNRPVTMRPRMIGAELEPVTKFATIGEARSCLAILMGSRDLLEPWVV